MKRSTTVHCIPLRDFNAVKTSASRFSFSQHGTDMPRSSVMLVSSPNRSRHWDTPPRAADTDRKTFLAPASRVSRIIKPALAHGSVRCTFETRATNSLRSATGLKTK